ncbi:MAG: hypothetical protein ACFFEE_05440 [Candidatus Thorarchaeota archaeon]
MTDFYFDDYDSRARERRVNETCKSIMLICVGGIAFVILYWFYIVVIETLLIPFPSISIITIFALVILVVTLAGYMIRGESKAEYQD